MEYAKQGDHAGAVEWFDRTIAADPNSCYAYFHKAKSQEQLGDLAGARTALETGLARARALGDHKAAGEIEYLLDELS